MQGFPTLALLLLLFAVAPSNINSQQWPQDPDARYKFVQETADQAVLAKLASVEEDWTIATAAVDKISDQKLLAEVARQASHHGIGRYAVKKLSDQALLAAVAINAKEYPMRAAALDKVTDQKLLAEIAMSDSDQAHYAIFPTINHPTVLTDPKALAEVALHSRSGDARALAIDEVSDQKVLAEIALNDPVPRMRGFAARRLTDQVALAKYLRDEKDPTWRKDGVSRVTDQALLKELALGDPHSGVRAAAVAMIRDQAFLKELVRREGSNDPYQEVWGAACRQIEDAVFLAEIAKSNAPAGFTALEAISQQALLADVAKGAAAREIRLKALSRLTDGQVQAQTAAADPDAYVREAVAKWPLRMVGTIDTTGLRYQGSINVYFVPVDEQGGMTLSYRNGQVDNLSAKLSEDYRSAVVRGNRPPTRVGFVLEVSAEKVTAGQRFTLAVGFTPPAPPSRPYGYGNLPQEQVSILQALDGKALATFRVEGLTRLIDIGTVTTATR